MRPTRLHTTLAIAIAIGLGLAACHGGTRV